MPRRHRLERPGGLYHVTTRGVDREFIFRDAFDRRLFFSWFGNVVARFGWRCYAYCLMGTHYHLVLMTAAANLAAGMHRLNGDFAREFNRRHRRRGHVFGERYGSTCVETDEHLLAVVRYVALNPVEAGLCESPEGWRWSSYRATAGLEGAPGFLDAESLLARFGSDVTSARRSYRRFVEGALG